MSFVWKHFDKANITNGKAKCTICKKEIVTAGGTTNLRNHLSRHHSICEKEETSVAKITSFITKDNIRPSQENVDIALCKYISKNMCPLRTVDSPAFKEFARALNPTFCIPSQKRVKSMLLTKFTNLKQAITDNLLDVKFISLTCDIWTCDRTADSYFGMSVHYINNSWELVSKALSIKPFNESHTGNNIGNILISVLEDYSIPHHKVVALVVDNAKNMNAAARQISFIKVGCFAHTLHLIICDAFKGIEITTLIGKCRKLVGHFKHSVQATHQLGEMQALFDLPKHKLKQDVITRWNSTLDMFIRLDEQRLAILNVFLSKQKSASSNDKDLYLSDEEWEIIQQLIPLLERFKLVTEAVCGEKHISACIVLPSVKHLIFKTADYIRNVTSELVKEVGNALIIGLKTRYDVNSNELLKKSALLDPKFKSLSFLNTAQIATVHNSFFREGNAIQALDDSEVVVETPCHSRIQDSRDNISVNALDDNTRVLSGVDLPAEPKCKKSKSAFDKLMFDISSEFEEPGTSAIKDIKFELKVYLEEKASDVSCLEWWKLNEQRFNILSTMAKKYLCIPATSVPCERLFSISGHVASNRRSSLLPKNVEMLTFLHENWD